MYLGVSGYGLMTEEERSSGRECKRPQFHVVGWSLLLPRCSFGIHTHSVIERSRRETRETVFDAAAKAGPGALLGSGHDLTGREYARVLLSDVRSTCICGEVDSGF